LHNLDTKYYLFNRVLFDSITNNQIYSSGLSTKKVGTQRQFTGRFVPLPMILKILAEVISLLERKKKKEGQNARLPVLLSMNWIPFKRRWLNSIK
jgi:hypothetical protein